MSDYCFWTDEHKAELRRLYDAGLSASLIAGELNARFGTSLTRNAVIGRCNREGFERRASSVKAPRGGWPAGRSRSTRPTSPAGPVATALRQPRALACKAAEPRAVRPPAKHGGFAPMTFARPKPAATTPKRAPAAPPPAIEEPGAATHVTLMQRRRDQCWLADRRSARGHVPLLWRAARRSHQRNRAVLCLPSASRLQLGRRRRRRTRGTWRDAMKARRRRLRTCRVNIDTLLLVDPELARLHANWIAQGYVCSRAQAWERRDGGASVRVVWRHRAAIITTVTYVARYAR